MTKMIETSFPECEVLTGRKRAICRGEAGIPEDGPSGRRAYRVAWGIDKPQDVTQSPQALPSLVIRGWNFANALARWALAGMPRRTQEQIDARLAICQACPALQNDHCTKCGCACVENNRLINKLALATEKCPDGKWE